MTLNRDLSGTGAMLVRLLGVGARGGLTPETTLLHVLDGVPLTGSISPEACAALLERIQQARPGPVAFTPGDDGDENHADSDKPLCFEFPESDDPAQQDRLDALNADAIERELGPECWNGPGWTPAKGSKADQALDLWSTTQLDYGAIASRTGSTREAVRSVVRKARERGEPRATRPELTDDRIRAEIIAEALALPLKRDQALLLWQRTSLRPGEIADLIGSTGPAVSNSITAARHLKSEQVRDGDRLRGIENSRPTGRNEAPMEVDGVGEDCATALPSKSDEIPPAGSNEEGGRADLVPDVSPQGADQECAEPADEPSIDRPADGASPAPHEVATPIEMGTVRQEMPPATAAMASPDTADRPAGPGLESTAPADQAIDAMVAGLAKKAGDPRLEQLLDLYGETTRLQKDIGAELGLSEFKISTLIKAARAGADPRVVAGDAARAALKAAAAAAAAAPAKAEAAPAPAAAAAPALTPGNQPPGDLVALKHDQVVAIDRNWIVGPTGAIKGFPLVNGALSALASGDLLPAAVVAQRSGARTGEAVLSQLQFWRGDLDAIGVEVVRVGPSDVRLRRKDRA